MAQEVETLVETLVEEVETLAEEVETLAEEALEGGVEVVLQLEGEEP